MLIHPSGAYNRAGVMAEAYRQSRQMRRFGWTFGRGLSFSWAKARAMREAAELAKRTELAGLEERNL